MNVLSQDLTFFDIFENCSEGLHLSDVYKKLRGTELQGNF